MIGAVGGWLAKSVLMQSPIGRVLKAIPWQVWLAIGLTIALFFAVRHHQHRIHELEKAAFAAGYAKGAEDGKRAVKAVERKSDAISAKIRSKTDEEVRRIARRADDLRVRGPGAAACISPALSVSASGHEPASGRSDAAGAGVPGGEGYRGLPQLVSPGDALIAIPFRYIVDQAEVADANRAEVLAWRDWHRRMTEAWGEAADAR